MDEATPDDAPFHAGEQRLQMLADVRDRAEQLGQRIIRDYMTESHRLFFAELPLLLIASLDDAGWPIASLLAGEPGFISSRDPRHLQISAKPLVSDPIARTIEVGASLGLLGIQFSTRRRNRLNGEVTQLTGDRFTVSVRQSYGNCPKYIHERELSYGPERAAIAPTLQQGGPSLSAADRALIASADTFFIASSSSAAPDRRRSSGVDMSHRGGPAGFVRIGRAGDRSVLRWDEYPGNNAYNTLGNLLVYPLASLLFVDFDRGTRLSVRGEAEIGFGADGSEHTVSFRVHDSLRIERALPLLRTNGTA
ncbi:MAG TPA: pyridoxamine 5'-phosphate oxidase family protein [Polyangiales bacterium]